MSATSAASPVLRTEGLGVVTLTLNRPERRNALSASVLQELGQHLEEISADPAIRAVVLAGSGPVFCAGHDLTEMVGRSEEEYRSLFKLCSSVFLRLRRLPQPAIARVHGTATAAGCQLVASCDLAVAADSATFATPGVKIGLFCTTPAVPLVRTIPPRFAMDMLLTGRTISAAEALAWGLVNRVVAADRLDEEVSDLTASILLASPEVIRLGKEALYRQISLDEEGAYELATEVMTANACMPHAQEGMSAFLQKRSPRWPGPGGDRQRLAD